MNRQITISDYMDKNQNIDILHPHFKKSTGVYTMQCGTQCMCCDYPIHFDTYSGCSHACEYCFANEKPDKDIVAPLNSINALKLFISGKRTSETRFCDWNIPVHWGATSDPFQPVERTEKKSLECLELFAQTGYPFIVSTKGTLIAEEPYISLIAACNCVVQISAACKEYDAMESGTQGFNERVKAIDRLSKTGKRVNIRIQPYFPMYFASVKESLKLFSDSGAYGIIIEGFFTRRKSKRVGEMEWNGSKFQYPIEVLAEHFKELRDEAHRCGLKFFSGETRLQFLGDDLTCCGTMGLDGFIPNKYNLPHLAHDEEMAIPTDMMQQPKTARPFRSTRQSTELYNEVKEKSFAEMMGQNEEYVEWLKELREVYG